jgi:hypothetical protein
MMPHQNAGSIQNAAAHQRASTKSTLPPGGRESSKTADESRNSQKMQLQTQ